MVLAYLCHKERAQNCPSAGKTVVALPPLPLSERAMTPQEQEAGSSVPAPCGAGINGQGNVVLEYNRTETTVTKISYQ